MGLHHRQLKGEGGADIGRTVGPDLTAMQGQDFFGDSQSQAGVLIGLCLARVALIKAFKDPVDVLLRNTTTGI